MKNHVSFLMLVLLLGGCAAESSNRNQVVEPSAVASTQNKNEGEIRVVIATHQNSIHLIAPETFTLSGVPFEKDINPQNEKHFQESLLTYDQLLAKRVYIEPYGEGQIEVNGKSFKGAMEIIGELGGTLTVINELPLEDYVMGVLAGEIPRDWPLEALKAQAIAARTFAVLKRAEAREKDSLYDLENTSQFQMYQGSGLVNEKIEKAVKETEGQIATYDSKPILAFFHSNCGGKTCASNDVWSQDKPYLKPVICPFGNNGAHFRWRTEMSIRDLVRQLRAAGIKIGDIVRLEALEKDSSERILKLSIMDADGSTKTLKASAFRAAVGPDVIRSTRFTAEIGQDKVIFNGKGWGHGVGLCQEGACGMALKGYSAFEILRYYYHGIAVEKMNESYP
jgi:stage II sporulation protein D